MNHAVCKRQTGVTLIELMIVIAIVGIVSAFAYPYYGNHVTKTRRTDAHLTLMSNAQLLERCKATSYTYVNCPIATDSNEGDYAITIESQVNSWVMTATATGSQVNDSECPEIMYTDLGVKSPAGCWPD